MIVIVTLCITTYIITLLRLSSLLIIVSVEETSQEENALKYKRLNNVSNNNLRFTIKYKRLNNLSLSVEETSQEEKALAEHLSTSEAEVLNDLCCSSSYEYS